jgi:REP element-mobilizing transposase RayT
MQLSEIGKLANTYWIEIPNHFPFVKLDAFVVIPNHVHGIVIIGKPNGGQDGGRDVETPKLDVSTNGNNENNTTNARPIHADFKGQNRFYDHIIRNDKSFQNIMNYIKANPENWSDDRFNTHPIK